ncbi:MAG TPA: response regulator transcription factor [Solirubrobacteraceae bacterium]|nr:response regulator transcription factor [Solirubrobacteraceae bacterium]
MAEAADPVPHPVRVAVADRRRLIAEALAALIAGREGFLVTGALVAEGAVELIAKQQPDVVVVGACADPRPAMELVRELRRRLPRVEIVIVADALEPALVSFVLDQGIGGLLLSDAAARDVAACLDHVAHGRAVLPSGWQGALSADRNDPLDTLSERQMEVLMLLADGCSYDEIATRLFISLNTVKFHVRSIFVRLGVRNRMAAARMLARHRAWTLPRVTHTVSRL